MTTSVSPDVRRIWQGVRWPLAIVALIVATGVVVMLARGDQTLGALEPGSFEPGGAHALTKLLGDEGVDVRPVHTIAEAEAEIGEGATLLVTEPDLVPTGRLDPLRRRAAAVVFVAPGPSALRETLPTVHAVAENQVGTLDPQCTVEAAVAAGNVTLGGLGYVSPGARSCYPGEDGATLLQVSDTASGTTTLLGTAAPLTNDKLASDGNAALTLHLLGKHPKLVWYLPSVTDPALDGAKKSVVELIPVGWRFGFLQVLIAVALLALWRARRLGPVVAEPLPIVVRAAETAEGRARLYRRAKASGHAGETLRDAARARLRTALGLPRDAEPAALVASVSARTGRHSNEIGTVLYGPPPAGDPALVRLAEELDRVEREVERS